MDATTAPTLPPIAVPIPPEPLAAFCRRWRVVRLELFGSVLRPADFRPDSDVDVIVTLADGAGPTAYTLLDMADELSGLLGRPAHVVTRQAVLETDRAAVRRNVLKTARVIYAG